MDILTFLVKIQFIIFKQFCCKEQENIVRLKVDVEVYSEKNLHVATEVTNEKKPSNNLNHSLFEKGFSIKNNYSELSIIEENRINNSEKILEITPCLTFPNLFLNYKNIIIDEYGLEGSSDNYLGKKTFFGTDKNYIENKNKNFSHINDVIINDEITIPNIKKTLPLFYIFFEQRIRHYLLKSLSKGIYFSLSINPYSQILLDTKHKNYFKLGNIVISIMININDNIIIIKIKKGGGIENEINHEFNFDKFPITIGRNNSTIDINNELISKNHVTINYDKINMIFYLIDNGSTNGTQLLLNEGKIIQLCGEMNFNLGEKQFKIIEK